VPNEVAPIRGGNDLILSIQGGTDQGRIQNYFLSGTNVVEEIRFADGTVWTEQTILSFLPPPPLVGTEDNDVLQGTAASELMRGLSGNDTLRGGGGNDTFEAGPGEDTILGGVGNDTYLFALADGGVPDIFIRGDDISDAGGYDVLRFGSGITPSGMRTLDHSDARGRMLVLSPSGTNAGVYLIGYFGTGHIEEIRFEDGTVWTDQTIAPLFPVWGTSGNDNMFGTVIADVMNGFDGNDTINGNAGHDTLDGGLGSDRLLGSAGNDSLVGVDGSDELLAGDGNDTLNGGLGGDTLYGDGGNDILNAGAGEAKNAKISNLLYGGAGDDVLISSGKPDKLYGEEGDDILLGAAQADLLEDTGGNNLLFGAAAVDDIRMGDQNDLVVGGTGNDLLDGDGDADGIRGRDILVFNKSDGADSVSRLGSGSTISIGGGTLYGNLSFEVVGTSLRIKTASSHYISLTDWYASPANKSVSTLQIVIEGTRDYKPTSGSLMNNKKIQAFDFLGLVAAFDAARAAGQTFSVANNLAAFRLWSSDTEAIGGAVAYQYARTNSIGGLTHDQMRAVIGDPAFAVSAQPIAISVSQAALDAEIAAETAANTSGALTVAADTSTMSEASRAFAASGPTSDRTVQADSIALESNTQSAEEGTTPPVSDFVTLPDAAIEHLPILPERAASRIQPEFLAPPTLVVPLFESAPPGAAIAGAHAAHAFESPLRFSGAPESRPASQEPLVGDVLTGSGQWDTRGDAAGAAVASASSNDHATPETDPLIEQWFTRHSWNDDLTLLDEIVRGDGSASASVNDGPIAEAWRRSHTWLNGYCSTGYSDRNDALDGSDLGATSLLGDAGPFIDMPLPVVGLRNVAGHDLKLFNGLRDGVNVLAQS
jgi:Ca2+-binding RTX toxin-like protein